MGLSRHERRTERRVQWRHVPPPPRIQCWRRVIGLHVCVGALSTLHGGVRGVRLWRGKRGQVVVIYDVFIAWRGKRGQSEIRENERGTERDNEQLRERLSKWNLGYLRVCSRPSDNQVSFQPAACWRNSTFLHRFLLLRLTISASLPSWHPLKDVRLPWVVLERRPERPIERRAKSQYFVWKTSPRIWTRKHV